jgi:peptidase M28-like protein
MPLLDKAELRRRVERLASIERGTASAGERQAAELIVSELESLGVPARLEEERVHGTYWWPLGILTAIGAFGGLARGRLLGLAAGAAGAAGVWDDLRLNRRVVRRRLLPQRTAVNVVAELGDADAEQTVLLMAHHDAAHSGIVFHPELPRAIGRRFPNALERANTTPPTMWGAVGGPALVALGSLLGGRLGRRLRRIGTFVSAGYAAAFADIGLRRTVPGANDNATGVAVLLSLAQAWAEKPPPGMRVILLSTSEESILEGMEAFARRHFAELPPERTHVINLDTVGSPYLLLLEGEGMLGIREYPKDFLALVKSCAEELGIFIWPDLRFRNATDGIVALKAGYPTAALASVDKYKTPTHYHWPTDTADNVHYEQVADAARLCEAVVLRLAAGALAPGESRGAKKMERLRR